MFNLSFKHNASNGEWCFKNDLSGNVSSGVTIINEEKFEDSKGIIRSRKLQTESQYNGQNKKKAEKQLAT